MGEQIQVHVEAPDVLTRLGITAGLTQRSDIRLVEHTAVDADTVVVLAADTVSEGDTPNRTGELRQAGCTRFVLVTGALGDTELRAAMEIGVCGIVERRDASPERLAKVITRATEGETAIPAQVLNRIYKQVVTTVYRPREVPSARLTNRESEVLRLVAEGFDTDEIAVRLSYSSRTVKNILHAVTTRFCLRNRSHAVAYAMREGLI